MTSLKKNITQYLIVLGLIGTMGACATTHVAAPNTSPAAAKIQAAKDAGAQKYAPDKIKSATKKLNKAKALVQQEKYKKASKLTREAMVDASLAMAATRSKKNQESINQLKKPIQELQREVSNMKAKMTSRGAVLMFKNMLFNFDKASLQPGAKKTISKLSRFLQDHPKLNVLVAGYTDNIGAKEYNQKALTTACRIC